MCGSVHLGAGALRGGEAHSLKKEKETLSFLVARVLLTSINSIYKPRKL